VEKRESHKRQNERIEGIENLGEKRSALNEK
jgi:hypothetical protein